MITKGIKEPQKQTRNINNREFFKKLLWREHN